MLITLCIINAVFWLGVIWHDYKKPTHPTR